ncbi:MAG: cytochrome c3 family protein [Desulfobacterales bacterium]
MKRFRAGKYKAESILFAALAAFFFSAIFSPAPGFAALERSSKKECALCHVMWLDVFKTNKETLIKWQPGNVLMKNTQGIVSSEEMCYSCHDGYVADARYTVWDYNNHPVFKKPSKDIKIPAALTLSNKNQIYCGTCHSPHSGRTASPGSSPEETIPGPLSFLKLPNVNSSLCEACHVNEADFKRTHGHPVHTDKLKIPETLFAHGSVKADKKNMVICETCHEVHGAKGRHITVMDNRQSALCMVCHKERTIAGTLHDARKTMPKEINLLGQSVSESGPCGACHVSHNSAGYKLWARKMVPGNPASQICLSCHRNVPDSMGKGIGRYSHPIDVSPVPKGQRQAAPERITARLPAFSKHGIRQSTGSIQCFTCHAIHQWDPDNPENRGGKNIAGNASNSFLRISASPSSALCVECHRDKRQILLFDHNLVLTAPEAKNIRGETAAVSGACGACHIPHHAVNKRLWARAVFKGNSSIPRYCTGCHSQNGAAKQKQVGNNDHPVDVVLKGKDIPPTARVIKILPLYNTKGGTQGGNRIMCQTCHDPHIWSAGHKGIPPDYLFADTTGMAIKNMEGDARNSFLRKKASLTPDLCVVCHKHTALLVGTDHDLFITAPWAKNQLGESVAQAGQCGVCHAVHNSGQQRLLWAQTYGPVEKNQPQMNSLCTCCHSKGAVAENKIVPVATHPKGKLIDNIFTFNNKIKGYIKIFNEDWKEVNVGDLSCSSCHSFYQWDHRIKEPGLGRNVEGNADTSFLRTSSDNTVCIDCHGRTAIWRYLYFHSLAKRAMLKGVRP